MWTESVSPGSAPSTKNGPVIGFGSLPIVLLVGGFTGMVMSLQSVYAFRQFGLESFAGGTTGKTPVPAKRGLKPATLVSPEHWNGKRGSAQSAPIP